MPTSPAEGRPPTDWETVIGLETHVQLLTRSKMFCGCSTDYDGAEPNTHVCPVCLGLPGTLPAANARAVEFAVRTGLALGCSVADRTHFDRKNYHYPDLPKGYQISQYDEPLCRDGQFTVMRDDGSTFDVGIERVHLEEDTGKSTHVGDATLVDYNRAGVPLVEIVTHPDLRSAEDAKAFLEGLRQLLRWIGVSTGNMEAGALRADVNVSMRPRGREKLGVKVEVKNLNSFGAVAAALAFEEHRLVGVLESGGQVRHETRGWSEADSVTVAQRTKEVAHDYRYFPEPDLPPLALAQTHVEAIASDLPELPVPRRLRMAQAYDLDAEAARLVTRRAETADYFEAAMDHYDGSGQRLATWITGPIFAHLKAGSDDLTEVAEQVPPENLAELAALVDDETLTQSAAKDVLAKMISEGEAASHIVERDDLGQIRDTSELETVVDQVINDNPDAVADFCGGKTTAIGFLVGGVMRATRGQADPNLARGLLQEALTEQCGDGS